MSEQTLSTMDLLTVGLLVLLGCYLFYQLLLLPVYRLIDLFQQQEADFDYGYFLGHSIAAGTDKALADQAYTMLQTYDGNHLRDGILSAVEQRSTEAYRLLIERLGPDQLP